MFNSQNTGITSNTPAQYDRAYLKDLIDQYLVALVVHDPSKLPLSDNVKFTENTVVLKPGEAFWRTASDMPTYKHIFTDNLEGQAGCFAVLKENGSPVLLALRLRGRDKLISEIETIVVRPQGVGPNNFASLSKPNPVFSEILDPSERSSREDMIKTADLYFDGIENDTGEFVKFYDECRRMENGLITANNTDPVSPSNPLAAMLSMSCVEQFKKKMFYFITEIRPRRYLLFDEERGLVLCNAMFVHAGDILYAEIEGRGKVNTPPFALRPSSVFVSELFKIQKGIIREIEVVGTMLPYGIRSGWDD
jgi:hypothetical protein